MTGDMVFGFNRVVFHHQDGHKQSSVMGIAKRNKPSRFTVLSGLMFMAFIAAPAAAQDCTSPNGNKGDMIYNTTYDVLQGCTTRGWMAFHTAAPPPPECPNVGDTCPSNGTIYAGTYSGYKLYVTAADAPGTVATGGTGSGTYTWNYGVSSPFDLDNASMPNCTALALPRDVNGYDRYSDQSNPNCIGAKGRDFTNYLGTFAGTGSPYNAASYCYNLGKPSDPSGPGNPLAHGRADWYLPAVNELEFIYDNLGPSPNHGFQADNYWSSTELSSTLGGMAPTSLTARRSQTIRPVRAVSGA